MTAPDSVSPPRAAVLLIGNELLSGKIRDENGWFLAGFLRRRGVELVEVCTVRDDLSQIGSALHRLLEAAPIVFTSGGVGPTHDDVTLEAIAAATGRPLERDERMADILREFYGDQITDAALAMADVPRGTVLRALPGWPVLRLDLDDRGRSDALSHWTGVERCPCVYILPGIPRLLRSKVDALDRLEAELPRSGGWRLLALITDLDESRLSTHLDEVVAAYPGVDIGSYPRWDRDDQGRLRVRVRVTLEAPGDTQHLADEARAALAQRLGDERVLALEGPDGD